MHELSYIDPTFRTAILYAIDHYEQLHPGKRQKDIARCREIANGEYHKNSLLADALKTYLESMPTGIRILGSVTDRIKTGHSTLKTLVVEALRSRTVKELVAYEEKVFEKIHQIQSVGSRQTLQLEKEALTLEVANGRQKIEKLEGELAALVLEQKTMTAEKIAHSQKLLALMEEQEKLSLQVFDLNQQVLALTEDIRVVTEENRLLRIKNEQLTENHKASSTKSSAKESPSRFRNFFGAAPPERDPSQSYFFVNTKN